VAEYPFSSVIPSTIEGCRKVPQSGQVEELAGFQANGGEITTTRICIHASPEILGRLVQVVARKHAPSRCLFAQLELVREGYMERDCCTACRLHSLGMPQAAAELVARIPLQLGAALQTRGLSGGVWTGLRMRNLVGQHLSATRAFLDEVDHIVAVCNWVRQVLITNGVSAERVTLCRHGIASEPAPPTTQVGSYQGQRPLRVAYLGRLDRVKGVDLLVGALAAEPTLTVTLDIFGIPQGAAGERYLHQLQSLAGCDERIRFHPPIANSDVIGALTHYDVVAVPSRWLETGPLVVLEAFAAGVPVLGTNLGGIAELVVHEQSGLLVKPDSIHGWREALVRLVHSPSDLQRLRSSVPAVRTMQEVGREMHRLYVALVSGMTDLCSGAMMAPEHHSKARPELTQIAPRRTCEG